MPVHTAYALPTGRDLRASPRNPILAAMAATVPIVGNSRENPSVYLRPIAQAISHRPATSRKSQAMGESSLKCLLISVPLHALCHSCSAFRARNSAAKNYEFEEKKTAYFGRGGSSPFSSTQALRPDSRNSE